MSVFHALCTTCMRNAIDVTYKPSTDRKSVCSETVECANFRVNWRRRRRPGKKWKFKEIAIPSLHFTLSQHFLFVRKFVCRNTKFEAEIPHLEQTMGKIKIMSTTVSSVGSCNSPNFVNPARRGCRSVYVPPCRVERAISERLQLIDQFQQ